MKLLAPFLALLPLSTAHYNFPSLIYQGTIETPWQHVRQWTDYYTYNPVTSVSTLPIRCNVDGTTTFAPSTLPVAAGATLGFTVDPDIYHAGPLLVYLAKVPAGHTAANWAGDGTVWFKIAAEGPICGTQAFSWPTDSECFALL